MKRRSFCIGAAVFIGLIAAASLLEFGRDPGNAWTGASIAREPTADALKARLGRCATMGDEALGDEDCRSAWDAARRRFLGLEGRPAAQSLPDSKAP